MSTASSRRPSARSASATATSPIRPAAASAGPLSRSRRFSSARPPRSTASAPRLAGAARRGRHDLDGRGRRHGHRRLLHPVALLGIRLGLRAAAHRRADAEPRRELLARPRCASIRWRPAGCRSTRSIRRSPCCATAASWPTAPWAATASRRPRPRCSPAMCCSASRSTRRSTAPRWLLGRTWGSTHTNLRLESRFDGQLIDRLMAAGHDVEVLDERLFRHDGPCRRGGAASRTARSKARHDPRADGGAAGDDAHDGFDACRSSYRKTGIRFSA